MGKFICDICKAEFNDDQYDYHADENHVPVTPNMIRAEDVNFIPEVEYDESGRRKRDIYIQKPYKPLTNYEG